MLLFSNTQVLSDIFLILDSFKHIKKKIFIYLNLPASYLQLFI